MNLHPDLARLLDHFDAVMASYEAQQMTDTQAEASIASATTIDALGWVWSIDPHEAVFMRARPGEAPEPADPAAFAVPQIPGPDLNAPTIDQGFYGPGASQESLVVPPTQSIYGDPVVAETKRGPLTAILSRLPFRTRRTRTRGESALGAKLAAHKRFLLIGALCLAAIVGISNFAGSNEPAGSTIPTDTTVPVTTTIPVAGPAADVVVAALGELTSGDPVRAQAVVVEALDANQAAIRAAALRGFHAEGTVRLVVGGDAVAADGAVTQTLNMVAPDGAVLGTVEVLWVQQSGTGTWQLATWPRI